MRKGCVLPIAALALGIAGLVAYVKTPAAHGVDVDTSAVSEEEGARSLGHGLDVSPRDLDEARALWETDELTEAREALEAALPEGEDEGVVHVLLSVVCRRLGDVDAAFDHGLRGAELLPTAADAHHVYALATMGKAMSAGLAGVRYRAAIQQELRNTVELDPTNLDAREMEAFTFLLPGYLGGDKDHALELAGQMEAYDVPRATALRAAVLGQMDRRDEARSLLEESLESHPGHGRLLRALGRLHEAEEDWSAADAVYALVPDPPQQDDDWEALWQRARLRTTKGRLDGKAAEGLAMIDRYLAEAPRVEFRHPADVHVRRGQALELLERTDDARAAYERALELRPDHKNATKALKSLQP